MAEKQAKENETEIEYPENHGKEWSVGDMWKLTKLYAQTTPTLTWHSIAQKMKRTIPACKFRMQIIRIAFSINKSLHADIIMGQLTTAKAIKHKTK